jgi:ABC transport system ATP-binding/permease protein
MPVITNSVIQLLPSYRLGRDPSNDTHIDHPLVSRFHATIALEAGNWIITDLKTEYGTLVNGKRLRKPRSLRPGDQILIGSSQFRFNPDETLSRQDHVGQIRLDAIGLNHQVGSTPLLRDISLSILPQEFVAIVGPSGAGKTTLLNTLCGLNSASEGQVLINHQDLYQRIERYRTTLGYVPQEDIIHRELTVNQALQFSARLRLPADWSASERQARIDLVLADLELSHRRHSPIRKLSGGERKRISIGVELLTQPALFFLDEATSGLDPGLETQMMKLLRRLSDQGRTVVLITHATKNVMLCDLVMFLTKGGRVAFWGPPAEALSYFGVDDFDQIYLQVEGDGNPPGIEDVTETSQENYLTHLQQKYRQSDYYTNYVSHRQQSLGSSGGKGKQSRPTSPVFKPIELGARLRQWWILSQRNLMILYQDRASLILMLLVSPILGVADFAVWGRDLFDVSTGNPADTFTMLFVIVLVAVMVGSLAMMREIVREADIYRRERMIGLKLLPYLASKVCLGIVLAIYQAAIFLVLKLWAVDFPIDTQTTLEMYFTIFLVTLAGLMMGLLISALSPNQNVAPLLTILFIVPQITFSGVLVPLESLGPIGQFGSQLTITRWGHETLVTLSGIGSDISNDPCWKKSETERNALQDEEKAQCHCLGPNLFTQCRFPGIKKEYHPDVDRPKPPQPQEPGAVPKVSEIAFDKMQSELDEYGDRVKNYTQAMETWQSDYGKWKENRGRAIAAGEALIKRYTEAEGRGYAVNLTEHWSHLGWVILGMLSLVLGIQKRKDRL